MGFFVFSLAPSQPPGKVMWNTSNSKIILNWEQVKALENESEVTGYKVSAVMTIYTYLSCLTFRIEPENTASVSHLFVFF